MDRPMIDGSLLAFTGVAALLVVTPGADTLLVIRNVLGRGRTAGLTTTAGIVAGCFVHATLSALGLSAILVRSATAFEVVRLAGAAYLVWLGLRSLAGAWRAPAVEEVGPAAAAGAWRSCVEGALTNVLNPKVAIFYLAFLPQFVRPGDPALSRSVLLAAIHVGLGLLWLSLVSLALGWLRGVVTAGRLRQRLEAITGVVLVGLGLRLALERR
jgi:threonine/homoserine/homoserine lactone efflux protein